MIVTVTISVCGPAIFCAMASSRRPWFSLSTRAVGKLYTTTCSRVAQGNGRHRSCAGHADRFGSHAPQAGFDVGRTRVIANESSLDSSRGSRSARHLQSQRDLV